VQSPDDGMTTESSDVMGYQPVEVSYTLAGAENGKAIHASFHRCERDSYTSSRHTSFQ
jgi:hypothetical protein